MKRKLRSLAMLGEAPSEASENIRIPELAPSDQRITGRTKPLSLKAKPEFHQELKQLAAEQKCLMIEILEQALECYEKHRKYSVEKLRNKDLLKDQEQLLNNSTLIKQIG